VDSEAAASKAADKLLTRGVKTVIITLGSRGAFVAGEGVRKLVPGSRSSGGYHRRRRRLQRGAGGRTGEGRPVIEAVQFANAAAAISVTRLGAQPSAPARKQIELLMASARTTKGVRRVNTF